MSNDAECPAKEGFWSIVWKFLYGGFKILLLGVLLFFALGWAIDGFRSVMFESSYDRLAPVMQNTPAWYQDLAKDVIDHESVVIGEINSPDDRNTAFWNFEEVSRNSPEDLAMPNAWLEKVANTPELTLSQLSRLRMMGGDRQYVSTTTAASWLLVVEIDLRNNQPDGWQAIDRRLKEGFSAPN